MPRLTLKPSPAPQDRRPGSHSGRSRILLAGCLLTLIFATISLLRPSFIASLDGRFFDSLVSDDRPPPGFRGPVVVALDDETLSRYGRWPWPRTLIADLLTRIARQRPACVGLDIIFAEPELRLSSVAALPAGPGGATGAAASKDPSPAGGSTAQAASPGDRALAKALAQGPFVLGYEFTFAHQGGGAGLDRLRYPLNLALLARDGAQPGGRFWQATGAIASLPRFSSEAAGAGFVNAAMEQDGVLRRMPILIRGGDRLYPSLALAAVLRKEGGAMPLLAPTWYGEEILTAGRLQVPLDERGRLLLHYHGWHGGTRPVSAADILDGRLPEGTLEGRVVLVGATATGMGEAVTTPVKVAPRLSGVQVHAIAAENMLLRDFVQNAPWPLRLLATVLLALLATAVCAYLPVPAGALVLALTGAACWLGSGWLFHRGGLFLPPTVPLIALFLNFSLLSPIRLFYGEARQRRQSRDLATTRDFIMSSLAGLTEIRDTETGAHILRTQRYLKLLCQELAGCPRYRHLLGPETIELLAKLAPLHDIGKVGLPDHLLHKTSAFTPEEYEEVKKHTAYGRDTIVKAEERSGIRDDELLRFAKDLAYSHHERWDGSGYPERLKGEEIPWAGRVMAIADTYDALISRRVYKEPIPHETAVQIIINGKGRLFDPDVVDAFVKVENQWWQIACELIDPEEEKEKPRQQLDQET